MNTWQDFDRAFEKAEAAQDFGRCAEIEAEAEDVLSPEDFQRFVDAGNPADQGRDEDDGPRCYCDPDEGHDCTYFTGGSGYN